jgi:ribosomal protein L25 (general stress protein Ctc)
MAITNLSVETRAAAGKGVARKLRAAGRVPAFSITQKQNRKCYPLMPIRCFCFCVNRKR